MKVTKDESVMSVPTNSTFKLDVSKIASMLFFPRLENGCPKPAPIMILNGTDDSRDEEDRSTLYYANIHDE